MRRVVIYTLLLLIIVFAAIIYYIIMDKQNNNNFQGQFLPTTPIVEDEYIILEVPILEYKNNNLLTPPSIVDYNQYIIKENQEFIIDPGSLGFLYENSVGAIKLQLINISNNSINVQVLADTRFDGNFHEREDNKTYEIRTKKCIPAYPLAMDVKFDYCFELFNRDKVFILRYFIETESTLPRNLD